MKKFFVLVLTVLAFSFLSLSASGEVKAVAATYDVAMITDSGTIDDRSFNQGTWEGIVAFCEANSISYKYYQPSEVSDNAYLDSINLAISNGAKVVVTPGYLFEVAVYQAQTANPNVKFVLIDGEPHTADYATYKTESNTLNILFNEHESGFLAGYAAVKDGNTKLGFTGGMAVPAVVKFGVGFVAGAYYAAHEMNVTIQLGNDNYVYFGDFLASDEHKNLASSWYVSGTQIIFSAAGGAGSSVMAAAEDNNGKVIGVDVDQSNLSDTVVTSAMKQLAVAVTDALQAYVDNTFEGGRTIRMGASNDGVALPTESYTSGTETVDPWNFDTFTKAEYTTIFTKISDGTIVVPSSYEELVTFLTAVDSTLTGYPEAYVINGTEAPAPETTSNNTWVYILVGALVVGAGAGAFFYFKKK